MTIRVLGEHHLLGHWRVADFLGGHPQKKTPMFETSLLWEGMFLERHVENPACRGQPGGVCSHFCKSRKPSLNFLLGWLMPLCEISNSIIRYSMAKPSQQYHSGQLQQGCSPLCLIPSSLASCQPPKCLASCPTCSPGFLQTLSGSVGPPEQPRGKPPGYA